MRYLVEVHSGPIVDLTKPTHVLEYHTPGEARDAIDNIFNYALDVSNDELNAEGPRTSQCVRLRCVEN